MEPQNSSLPIVALSEMFISERRSLQNVSPHTLEWYRCSFNAFRPYLAGVSNQNELRSAVRKAVMQMSEAGELSLRPRSKITPVALTPSLKWLVDEKHVFEHINPAHQGARKGAASTLRSAENGAHPLLAPEPHRAPCSYDGARDTRHRNASG